MLGYPIDLFPILKAIDPDARTLPHLVSYFAFGARYCAERSSVTYRRAQRATELKSFFDGRNGRRPLMLRRIKVEGGPARPAAQGTREGGATTATLAPQPHSRAPQPHAPRSGARLPRAAPAKVRAGGARRHGRARDGGAKSATDARGGSREGVEWRSEWRSQVRPDGGDGEPDRAPCLWSSRLPPLRRRQRGLREGEHRLRVQVLSQASTTAAVMTATARPARMRFPLSTQPLPSSTAPVTPAARCS
jgi:hypothetical protein